MLIMPCHADAAYAITLTMPLRADDMRHAIIDAAPFYIWHCHYYCHYYADADAYALSLMLPSAAMPPPFRCHYFDDAALRHFFLMMLSRFRCDADIAALLCLMLPCALLRAVIFFAISMPPRWCRRCAAPCFDARLRWWCRRCHDAYYAPFSPLHYYIIMPCRHYAIDADADAWLRHYDATRGKMRYGAHHFPFIVTDDIIADDMRWCYYWCDARSWKEDALWCALKDATLRYAIFAKIRWCRRHWCHWCLLLIIITIIITDMIIIFAILRHAMMLLFTRVDDYLLMPPWCWCRCLMLMPMIWLRHYYYAALLRHDADADDAITLMPWCWWSMMIRH